MADRLELTLADGRTLEVHVHGMPGGVPIVFHNGTPGGGNAYAPFVALAAGRGLRLITYARPGYARSTRNPGRSVASVAPDVAELLDQLGASRCYTVGWSGGGPHALATAALLPDRVIAAATIAGVAPYRAEGLNWMAGMGRENLLEFEAALEGQEALRAFLEHEGSWVRSVTAEQVANGFGDLISEPDRSSLTGPFADWQAASFRAAVSTGIWGWFDDDMAFTRPWGFELGAIERPVAIWQGAQDRMVPFAHGEWLAAHVGSATAHLLPQHGHLSLAVGSMAAIIDDLLTIGGG